MMRVRNVGSRPHACPRALAHARNASASPWPRRSRLRKRHQYDAFSFGCLRERGERLMQKSVEKYLENYESEEENGKASSASGNGSSKPNKEKKASTKTYNKLDDDSSTGHWALRSLNEVEATAMGVEIRLHSVKGAIVDAKTGNFLSRGASVKLENGGEDEIKTALRRIQKEFAWDGPVGCSTTIAVARSLGVEGTSFTNMGNDVGKVLKKFLPRNSLVTMVHTEAAGYAELSFDNSLRKYLEEDELVLVCTIGQNLGAVLYNGGHRMRNIGLNRAITKTFGQNLRKLETEYKDAWVSVSNANYLIPSLPGAKAMKNYSQWPKKENSKEVSEERKEESWQQWVSLVDSYLIQLADYVKPTCIIVMPTGAYTSAPLVESMMPQLTVQDVGISKPNVIPVSSAVGAVVKGAAVGALVELKVQEAIATMRNAVGQDIVQLSTFKEEQLRAAFDYFDDNGDGIVTEEMLKSSLQNLVSSLSPELIEKKLSTIKSSTKGEVTFEEFNRWWETSFGKESPVTFITSEAEFNDILEDPFPASGDLKDNPVILEVGFSFCRPCKRFEPKYEEFAEKNKDIRFVRMNGNENEDTIQFCKEGLQVRKTPSFYVFKGGKQVLSWTGANEETFTMNLAKANNLITSIQ